MLDSCLHRNDDKDGFLLPVFTGTSYTGMTDSHFRGNDKHVSGFLLAQE